MRNLLADLGSGDSASFLAALDAQAESTVSLAVNSIIASRANDEEVYKKETDVLDAAATFNSDLTAMLEGGPEFYKQLVDNRSRREPRLGKCDAILFAAVPLPSDILVRQVHAVAAAPKHRRPVHGALSLITDTPPETNLMPALDDHLLLPHTVVQYNAYASSVAETTLDGGRMALVSLVACYSALGIEDHSFYSLVMSNMDCLILMAWKSSTQQVSSSFAFRAIFHGFSENVCD